MEFLGKKNQQNQQKQQILYNNLKFNTNSTISMGKHQKKANDFINKECDSQKGMVLWHTMGSGKTITSWNIAMNFPLKDREGREHKRIILGPI